MSTIMSWLGFLPGSGGMVPAGLASRAYSMRTSARFSALPREVGGNSGTPDIMAAVRLG